MQPSYTAWAGRASIVKFTACVTGCLASSVRLAIIMSFHIFMKSALTFCRKHKFFFACVIEYGSLGYVYCGVFFRKCSRRALYNV